MACINCFFSLDFQRRLKMSSFGYDRFENRLKEYKKIYLNKLIKLVSVNKCSCNYHFNSSDEYINFTDKFLYLLKNNMLIFDEIFDILINVYDIFITKSYKHAADYFWNTISIFNLMGRSEIPMSYSHLLYRARKIGDYSKITDFFHIPFDRRELVVNNRFSISGQPMIYFGNSIMTLTKELDLDVDNLSIAAFLPKYSIYYPLNINEVENSIFSIFVNSLPALFNAGSNIKFNEKLYIIEMRRTIFCELLTFPCKIKGTFVEEYVLPQLFTSLLIDNNYKGVIFPSTKNFSEITNYHRFSKYNKNLALFIDYNENDNYDLKLLNTFYYFVLDGSEKFEYTTNDIIQIFEKVINLHKKFSESVNNNDYILPIVNSKLYIEYLEEPKINGINYFKTKEGRIELEFFYKLADKLFILIAENIKRATGIDP